MPLQFTQARVVAAGDPVGAGDMASLAQSVNTRLVSGIGDFHYRVAYYLHSLFRKMRNDEGTLATPEAEFWTFYQGLGPNDGEWPTAEPGEATGANLANPLNQFVFGSEALNLDGERGRLGNVNTIIGLPPGQEATAADYWQLGKDQRGAYDPSNGNYSSPMLGLGMSYAYIRSSLTSRYGNSYGGYFPTPADAGGCDAIDDGSGGFIYPPNLQIQFTNLQTGEVVAYCGTCPDATLCPDDDRIAYLSYSPFAYFVFLYNGAVDVYPKSQWIEGPYTSDARLSKASANAISRVVAQFSAEFRGDATQRAESDQGQGSAFLFEEFLTEQYPLAPQIGTTIGDEVLPFYPAFYRLGSSDLEQGFGPMPVNSGGNDFTFPEGSLSTHFLLVARGVASDSVSFTITENGEPVETRTLTIGADGSASQIVKWPTARTFTKLEVQCEAFTFSTSAGFVAVEFNFLLEYKPQLYDLYATLRLSTYRGGLGMDGSGIEESQSREVYDNLQTFGCIVPVTESSSGLDIAVNQNAVYDAARRMSKCVRILPRHNLVGYAVQGGKSVLYFRRYAFGMSHTTPIDLLAGIAPSATQLASGELLIGRTYEVTSGFITHGTAQYNAGDTFTATSAEFSGSGVVRETSGVYDAYPRGYSNKWTVDFGFKPYYWSSSSLWKLDAFADVYNAPFGNRCTFDDLPISLDDTAVLHVGYGTRPLYFSENPSGYNYMPTPEAGGGLPYANYGATSDHMKSCRIYEPPAELESTEIDDEWTATFGEQIVKVTLTSRLHHHESAPSSIDADTSTWDITGPTGLAFEVSERRTVENAIREYILYDQTGRNCANAGAGDFSATSTFSTDFSVFGTCIPSIFFVQQIPEPWLDGNTSDNATDSPALSDHLRLVELYLRAGCEGFVDGRTSLANACASATTTLYDFTWENLNFQANDNRHVALMPEEIRSDNPPGHGPMPMTYFYAETFNSLARCVNELTTARVMIPATLESRVTTYVLDQDVTNTVLNATGATAATDGFSKAGGVDYSVMMFTGSGGLGTPTVDIWIPGVGGSIATSVDLSADGTTVTKTSTMQSIEFRWSPTSSFADALTDDVAGLLSSSPAVYAEKTVGQTIHGRTVINDELGGTTCDNSATTNHVWTLGSGSGKAIQWDADTTSEEPECVLLTRALSEYPPAAWIAFSDSVGDIDPPCKFSSTRGTGYAVNIANTPAITVPTVEYSDGD
jgi:hypothetical protein